MFRLFVYLIIITFIRSENLTGNSPWKLKWSLLSKVLSFVNTQRGKLGSFFKSYISTSQICSSFLPFLKFLILKSVNLFKFCSEYCLLSLIFKKIFFQVKWKKSDVKFEDRFDKYLDPSFFQHRVGKLCTLRHSVCASVSHTVSNCHL